MCSLVGVSKKFPKDILQEIYGWVFFSFTPMTKEELRSAIILCKINRKKGLEIYGDIRQWDTSNITDISSYDCFQDCLNHKLFCHNLMITETPTLCVTVTGLSHLREFNNSTFALTLFDMDIPSLSVWKLTNGKWLVNLLAKSFFLTGNGYRWLVDVCNAGKEGMNMEHDGMIFTFKVCSDREELISPWRTASSV